MKSLSNTKRPMIFWLLPLLFSILIFHGSCKNEHAATEHEAVQQTYTCPMHPQIVQNESGTCPICGMDLVPFDKNNVDEFLTLSESQRALANITTMTVGT